MSRGGDPWPDDDEAIRLPDGGESLFAPNGGDLTLWIEEPCRHSRFRRAWDNLRGNDHGEAHYREVAVARAVSGPVRPISAVEWEALPPVADGMTLNITWKADGTVTID